LRAIISWLFYVNFLVQHHSSFTNFLIHFLPRRGGGKFSDSALVFMIIRSHLSLCRYLCDQKTIFIPLPLSFSRGNYKTFADIDVQQAKKRVGVGG
jgi:hypothetical protein